MAAGTTPIFPASPYCLNASLAAATACTTRAPTAVGSIASLNAVVIAATSTNGVRIDKIQVQACSSSISAATVAQTVLIWLNDGTNLYVIDEIAVTVVTPSTTTPAFNTFKTYTNLVLPSTFSLYASTTITTTASTTALSVTTFGGTY